MLSILSIIGYNLVILLNYSAMSIPNELFHQQSHKLNFNWNFRLQFILTRFMRFLDKALNKSGQTKGVRMNKAVGVLPCDFPAVWFPAQLYFLWQNLANQKKQRNFSIHSKKEEDELSFVVPKV